MEGIGRNRHPRCVWELDWKQERTFLVCLGPGTDLEVGKHSPGCGGEDSQWSPCCSAELAVGEALLLCVPCL